MVSENLANTTSLQADPATDEVAPAPLSIEMDKRADLAVSLVVAAVGAFVCYVASGFRTGTFPDPVTARGLPYFAGGFMVLAGLVNAVRRIISWSSIPGNKTISEGTDDEPGHPASALRAFAIVALALAWAVLVQPASYLIANPLVLFGMLLLMGVRSAWKLIGFPLLFTLVIWLAFSQVLHVVLPMGPLADHARAWGLMP